MRRFLKANGLSLVFLLFFVLALAGQAFAGWHDFNDQASAHQEPAISLGRYLTSSAFGNAVLENWQSEYLQFTLYILLTVWFIQKGSTESKAPGEAGRQSDEEQRVGAHAEPDSPAWAVVRGFRRSLYSNSLVGLMALIWVLSWFGQAVTGWSTYNSDQITHHQPEVSFVGYLGTADFWQATLQNWQSEFLAVGSMLVFSIYLRQRGSPESKPVGAPHAETGSEG
jgi:hypothetical protein